jgi:hypothetical protein
MIVLLLSSKDPGILGNEDGAHDVTAADLFQAFNDEGWTILAASAC